MSSRDLAVIKLHDLQELRIDLQDAERSNEDAVAEAVNAANKSAATSAHFESQALKSKHEVATAALEANNGALNDKVEFLTAQVTSLQSQIDSDRAARIEIAANTAQPEITVNSGKQ